MYWIFDLTSGVSFFCWDTATEDEDMRKQIDKLWQEVNSLKEMQALQTGKQLYTTDFI